MFAPTLAAALLTFGPPPVVLQGALSNAGGAVSGTYAMTVTFYDGEFGQVMLSKVLPSVTAEDGVFVLSMDGLPIGESIASGLWVGVRVENEPELKRVRMGAAAVSLIAWESMDIECYECVGTGDIASNSLHGNHYTPYSVGEAALNNDAVTSLKLGPQAVTQEKIALRTIGHEQLDYGSVQTENIGEDAIVAGHIQADSITHAKLADLAVGTAEIQDQAVTTAKIAANAIKTEQIAEFGVTTDDLALKAVVTARLDEPSVSTPKLWDSAVTTIKLNDGAVTKLKIAPNAVDSSRLALTVSTGAFCDTTTAQQIPGSSTAIFCSLGYVDDDSAAGWCKVAYVNDKWMMQTGGGCGANGCEWICVK